MIIGIAVGLVALVGGYIAFIKLKGAYASWKASQ